MPGSIQNAAPATVLPQSLSRAFARSQEYPVIENEYRNGESQRSVPVNNSRKRWRLAKRLQPTKLQALRDFFEARGGPTEPFYFTIHTRPTRSSRGTRPALPQPADTPSDSTASGARPLADRKSVV